MNKMLKTAGLVVCVAALLAACGRGGLRIADDGPGPAPEDASSEGTRSDSTRLQDLPRSGRGTSLFDAFGSDRNESDVAVNRYIWSASLEVLDFLPLQTVDPFSGVIVTGFGAPPNGGQAYRATILIRDPALDARSLNVALQTRSGPASDATVRAVEDAILTRARQLRFADSRF